MSTIRNLVSRQLGLLEKKQRMGDHAGEKVATRALRGARNMKQKRK